MTFTLRPYQNEAVEAALAFFRSHERYNAIEVLPTGSGKSLIIADLVDKLGEPVLVFQPSKEILEQNLAKLQSYGFRGAVYSASKGRTEVSNITFATIGSVVGKDNLFENFQNVIVDECHLVNPMEGMYRTFLGKMEEAGAKILGLTATPYRLFSDRSGGWLEFLVGLGTFHKMIYHVQNRDLFNAGYLSRLEYVTPEGFNRDRLVVNGSGADFTEESVLVSMWASNTPERTVDTIRQYQRTRKNALVFTRFVAEASHIAHGIDGAAIVTGTTPKKKRDQVINGFKRGDIPVVVNVGVLTTGFDFPELDTVVIARPTRSLALYYQMIGRATRPHPEKDHALVVDMCGNYETFGRVEDLEIQKDGGDWCVSSGDRRLTGVYFGQE